MRIHQWSKNLLLGVPAVVGQVAGNPGVARTVLIAFLAFSVTASGNYLLNDVIDIDADRRHPRKRLRPIASGRLPVVQAAVAAPLLMALGLATAFVFVNEPFGMMLLSYVVLALAYSKFFKRLLILDVLVLAVMYTLRLLAGGAAVDVAVSSWLLVFSMFFFVSLAFAKRLAEIDALAASDQRRDDTRAYGGADRGAFAAIGPSAGMVSILVMALYVSSDAIRAHYHQPDVLWILCPLMLYWVLRVWFFALRGELHYDPVVFALRDRVSYAVAAAVLTVLYFAAR